MLKNKYIRISIGVIICALLSTLIEVIGFNFNPIFHPQDSASDVAYTESNQDDDTIYAIDTVNTYVRKLIINYSSTANVKYQITYETNGLYDNPTTTTIDDIFDRNFSRAVINIDNSISNLQIKFSDQDANAVNLLSFDFDNAFHFNYYRTIFIFLALLLLYSLILFFKAGFKTEKLHIYFATCALLLGSMIIIAQPASTFYSPDDQIHFGRILDFSGINFVYKQGEVHSADLIPPDNAGRNAINSIEEQQAQNLFFNQIASSQTHPSPYLDYSTIGYLPSIFGYHLARLFDLPFSICFRVSKFFNLLVFVLLVAYAIKTIKFGKRILAIIALIPKCLFLASQYSYDPAVFAGLSVFFAHLVNLYTDKTSKFDFKTALIMLASFSFAAFTKPIYAPLLLLSLFIPKSRFQTPKQSHLVKTGIASTSIMLLIAYILPAIGGGNISSDFRGGNTSVSGQISTILTHPIDFLHLLGNTAVAEFSNKFLAYGNNFSYISIAPDPKLTNFNYISLFLLFFFFLTDNSGNRLNKKQRLLTISTTLLTIILIWSALYVSFTPVGSSTIEGVQDRYFLPLLLPLLLCLQIPKIKNQISPKIMNGVAIIIPTACLFIFIYFSIFIPYSF